MQNGSERSVFDGKVMSLNSRVLMNSFAKQGINNSCKTFLPFKKSFYLQGLVFPDKKRGNLVFCFLFLCLGFVRCVCLLHGG